VVFGDLIHRWSAMDKWTSDYLVEVAGDVEVPIYSNEPRLNAGLPHNAISETSFETYLNDLLLQKNDLRVSNLPLRKIPQLESDFVLPRLGFDFDPSLISFGVGGDGAVEPMRQSPDITHTLQCHFGEPTTLLLFPPSQTPFIYKVGISKNSISSIDFDKPQYDSYPAIKGLTGYVAEMKHGDAIYIPPGFWWCTAYQGFGVNLSLRSVNGSFSQFLSAGLNRLANSFMRSMFYTEARLQRKERRTQLKTNVWYLKRR